MWYQCRSYLVCLAKRPSVSTRVTSEPFSAFTDEDRRNLLKSHRQLHHLSFTTMTDISSFQHKFRANGSNGIRHNQASKVNKRIRVPVSCGPCRDRKLKCDKKHPCDSCVKRGDTSSCSYQAPSNSSQTSGSIKSAHERLHHLEGLVKHIIESDSTARPVQSPSNERDSKRLVDGGQQSLGGLLSADGSESSYVGATNWAAVLDSIQELKFDFVEGKNSPEEEDEVEDRQEKVRGGSLFSVGTPPSLEYILRSMPPRSIVDRRLSVYFNAKYAIIPVIHTYHFQRMYEAFWKDPLNAPVQWIAQLFAILCISAGLSEATGSEHSSEGMPSARDVFVTATAQCLTLGEFTKPKPYVMEALMLYGQCEYMSTLDPSGDVWIVFGIILRQALRMGYHRDPKHLPNMSPFEGEMRRRSWAMIRHFELMISFQMGLPSYVQEGQYDTALPRNLLDSDFDESSTELPPSRPETEPNQVLYFIAKGRMMAVFEKILNQELSTKPIQYEKVMEIEAELRQAHDSMPPVLKNKPMEQSFADPSHVIMVRLNLELLFLKGLCMLHRKYLIQKPYSRKVCPEAACAILGHQISVHQEAQPGGQLYQDRWMLSSFTFHDFFLASMVLCLDVSTSQRNRSATCVDDEIPAKLERLQDSYFIFTEQGAVSREARRVSSALATLLTKLKPDFRKAPSPTSEQSAIKVLPTPPLSLDLVGSVSDLAIEAENDPIENLITGPENVDWVSSSSFCRLVVLSVATNY